MQQGRLFRSFVLVALASTLFACKPRGADSGLLADGGSKSSKIQIQREVVANLAVEDTDAQRRAKKFVKWAGYWAEPSVDTDKVETPPAAHVIAANQLAIKLHATAGSHATWLKTALAAKEKDKSGMTTVTVGDVQSTLQTYEAIQSTLEPFLPADAWSTWSAEFGKKASSAFADAAEGFGLTLAEVSRWKPSDNDLAIDKLEEAQKQGAQTGAKTPPVPTGSNGDGGAQVGQPDKNGNQPPEGKPTVKVVPQSPQKIQGKVIYDKAEEQRLAWLKFVQTAERHIVDGTYFGKMPTLDEMRAAIAKAEQAPVRQCNDGRPEYWSTCRGQPIIDALSQVEEIKGLYSDSAGVSEGYSVRQHTERVLAVYLEQRKFYGYPKSDKRYELMMPIVVALHDIGKPVAARTVGTQAQHEHNQIIVRAMLKHLGFDEGEVAVGATLVSGDLLGWAVRNNVDSYTARNSVQEFANQAGVPAHVYYHLLRTEYIADAASYPSVKQTAFYQDQSGKLNDRNGVLDRLSQVLVPPPAQKKPEPKVEPKTDPVQSAPSAQQIVKGEINNGNLGPAGETAALNLVEKKNGGSDVAQAQSSAGEVQGSPTEGVSKQPTDLASNASESGTKSTEAAPAAAEKSQAAKPEPPFVGHKFVGGTHGLEILGGGACHFYWTIYTNPDWFAQATYKYNPATRIITVTYPVQDGSNGTQDFEYRTNYIVKLEGQTGGGTVLQMVK